jgi:CBS domain containing-hemolysin-like protein
MIWFVLFGAFMASAIFSGAETGLYRLSQPRLDVEARAGRRSAKLLRYLLSRESALLVTILIGNNLALQVLTWKAETLGSEEGGGFGHELLVVLFLTPLVFLFGEALPKDIFRRRPHAAMAWTADFLFVMRIVLWPAERVLSIFSKCLAFVFGIEGEKELSSGSRESVERLLHEGTLLGALEPRAEELARNALALRGVPLERVMTPWDKVVKICAADENAVVWAALAEAQYSRLPVVSEDGVVTGYLHQLDVLGAGEASDHFAQIREVLTLEPSTSVDRAIARLRLRGVRMAVVGTLEAPVGLVALKDLLEEISGDLGSW